MEKPLKAIVTTNGNGDGLVLIEGVTEAVIFTDKEYFENDYSGLVLNLYDDGIVVEGSVEVGSIIKWEYIRSIDILR